MAISGNLPARVRALESEAVPAGESDEQFYYKTRKRAWGPFKKETWDLPEATWKPIGEALEAQFGMLMEKLGVVDTVELVKQYVPAASKFELPPAK